MAFEGATIDDIYEAFAYAETGSFNDPWIRTTHQPKGGSTAYGPVQMTGGSQSMIQYQLDNLGKTGIEWNDKEVEFMNKMTAQAELFSKYGGEDMKEGMERYGYGGKGDIATESDKKLYQSIAKKLMKSELKRSGGIYNLKREWRGKEDSEYFEKFDSKLNSILKQRMIDNILPDDKVMNEALR